MSTYLFCYLNKGGRLVRSTTMQCRSDANAIRKAFRVMSSSYRSLEVFESERFVYRSPVWLTNEPLGCEATRH